MRIFKTDIKDKIEFERIGYLYKRVKDYGNNIYLYKMEKKGEPQPYSQYELVKGVKVKQPDGSIVHTYPSDEQFGTFGFYIWGSEEQCQARIQYRLGCLKEKNNE